MINEEETKISMWAHTLEKTIVIVATLELDYARLAIYYLYKAGLCHSQ
jgi:hypothetical protein